MSNPMMFLPDLYLNKSFSILTGLHIRIGKLKRLFFLQIKEPSRHRAILGVFFVWCERRLLLQAWKEKFSLGNSCWFEVKLNGTVPRLPLKEAQSVKYWLKLLKVWACHLLRWNLLHLDGRLVLLVDDELLHVAETSSNLFDNLFIFNRSNRCAKGGLHMHEVLWLVPIMYT